MCVLDYDREICGKTPIWKFQKEMDPRGIHYVDRLWQELPRVRV